MVKFMGLELSWGICGKMIDISYSSPIHTTSTTLKELWNSSSFKILKNFKKMEKIEKNALWMVKFMGLAPSWGICGKKIDISYSSPIHTTSTTLKELWNSSSFKILKFWKNSEKRLMNGEVYGVELQVGGYVGKRLISHIHPLFILHLPHKRIVKFLFLNIILKKIEKIVKNALWMVKFMGFSSKFGDMWEKDWYLIFIPYSYYIYHIKRIVKFLFFQNIENILEKIVKNALWMVKFLGIYCSASWGICGKKIDISYSSPIHTTSTTLKELWNSSFFIKY